MKIQGLSGSDTLLRNKRRTSSKLQKSLEKLSSGYQINRAADDAARLAISEKIRTIMAGLEQGTKNIDDGISYIHTQEGAAQEIHNMLHRMEELAVQAANGTYSDMDRDAINSEYRQLIQEIGHITDTSDFNGVPLFEKHMHAYGMNEGVVVHDKPIVINSKNSPLVIGYTVDGKSMEYSVDIPHGEYRADELADMIDTELYREAPNLIIGINEDDQFTMQVEPGQLDYIGGPGASLFYESSIGQSDGYLLGVTVFQSDTAKLQVYPGENDVMSFRVGSDDTLYSIVLDPGRYTRSELIDHINQKLSEGNIPGNVRAVAELNDDGGKIIGLASESTITGLCGNFIKIDKKHSPIYDISCYGYTENTQSVLAGKKVINANTEILRGRNDYFTLDLKWYGENDTAASKRITINLLDADQNEKVYASPNELIARINEQLGDDLPFTAKINNSGAIEISSDQYGGKCNVDLVESDAPSKYMVYDLFDAGTLNRLTPSRQTSQFTPASLTSNKVLAFPLNISAGENELSFTIVKDSGTETLNITLAAGDYSASDLETALNNAIPADYLSKLEFTVGQSVKLSAIRPDGTNANGSDIKSISVDNTSSAYEKLISGYKYVNNYEVLQGRVTSYRNYSGNSAVSSAGSSVNIVEYTNQTTSVSGKQYNYINYSYVTPQIKNGYEEEIETEESFVGDVTFVEYPAKMTLSNVMSQFTVDGVSRRDINFALSVTDDNGTSDFNIIIPKGSTKEQALSLISNELGSTASAAVNGNDLVITSGSKGNGVTISCGNSTMCYSASKSSYASDADAVVDAENNKVYLPATLTIPNVNSQLPYTVDASNDRLMFRAGNTNYDLRLTQKTYTSAQELAAELNAKIAESDGGTAKTTVSADTNGKSLIFKGPAKEGGSITIDSSSSCNIYKTKVVNGSTTDPNYDPATGMVKKPAQLVSKSFKSLYNVPLAVNSANNNNTVTFKYGSPSGSKDITITIPDGEYSSSTDVYNAIKDVIANDPDLSSIITVKYPDQNGNLCFETIGKGSGYTLTNLGGTANFNKYMNTPSGTDANSDIDSLNDKIYYPAQIKNSTFWNLFQGEGVEINSSNKHISINVNGTDIEFDLTEGVYVGDSGINSVINQLNAGFSGKGLSAKMSGTHLIIQTDDKNAAQTISVNDNSAIIYKKRESEAAESRVNRVDNRCSITGKTYVGTVEIHDYDNQMTFDYSETINGNPVSGTVTVTVPAGSYTADALAAAIQTSIDDQLNPGLFTVSQNNGYLSINASGASSTRSMSNFKGRLFDKVFQNPSYYSVKVHTETPGVSKGDTVSYIVGRNKLEPKNEDEINSGKNVTIYTGLNDSMIFDFNYGGITHTIEFEIPAGDYTPEELADAIENAGRAEFAKLTDHSGKSFPEDFFNASIGLSELGVPENDTGISSADKLVLWCKLPDDGRNGLVTAVIDGIRGNSAYRVFYDATRSPEPTIFLGKPDLSEGITISGDNDTIGFSLDGEPCSIRIPHGEYELEELVDTLNTQLERMGTIVRVGKRDGHIMFYTTENGDYVFDKFTGNAADALIYDGEDREDDTEIGIHTGRRTDTYVMYEKTRIDEHLMHINTTGVTTVERALKAIDRLEGANNMLSSARAVAGANENRSVHSRNNNTNYIENLTAAESRMRDSEMAKQYAELTKAQIMSQAQEHVYAQMKEAATSVLDLLA